MMKFLKTGLLLLCCLTSAACASMRQENIRDDFDKSMKGYNRMVRWHEIESAGATYLEPELREAFLKSARVLKKKGVTITDYRILSSECLAEKESAEVVAEFDYYTLPSNRIKTLTYQQNWIYREINGTKSWKLKSTLPDFD
jgi:hypothetical protein